MADVRAAAIDARPWMRNR